METNAKKTTQIEVDLCLNRPFVQGQASEINNCWHFSTDGTAVDTMFFDEQDFRDGMNRIYLLTTRYDVTILAFSLMDTHVHFILYGEYGQCNRFMHEYVRQISWNISVRHGDRHKFRFDSIHCQKIDTDVYLKTAICYVIKNAPVGGIHSNAYDYPWSSAALYFRNSGFWTSPLWTAALIKSEESHPGKTVRQAFLKTHTVPGQEFSVIDGIVFPGEYVDYHLVERIFRTHKSFNFFMCISKEKDVEERGGSLSYLSLPMQEMRQHKTEVCRELYGVSSIRALNTSQRLQLAKALKARFNSSPKQVARLCGLIYSEVKNML